MPAQASLKSRKFKGWPKGPNGEPALTEVFGGDVKAAARQVAKRELSDSAMDAVFDSFVGSPLSIVADRCAVRHLIETCLLFFPDNPSCVLPLASRGSNCTNRAISWSLLPSHRCTVMYDAGAVGCVFCSE